MPVPACRATVSVGPAWQEFAARRDLSAWNQRLIDSGSLVISIPNSRHHSVISGLIDGNWTHERAGLLDDDHVRCFTRRKLEKLLFRAGFEIGQRVDNIPMTSSLRNRDEAARDMERVIHEAIDRTFQSLDQGITSHKAFHNLAVIYEQQERHQNSVNCWQHAIQIYAYYDQVLDAALSADAWKHHQRSTWVWTHDRFIPYPFQLNLHYLPRQQMWECVQGLLLRPVPPCQPGNTFRRSPVQ